MKHARILRWSLALGLLLALVGCPEGSGPGAGAAATPVDAGPPPPPFDVNDGELDVVRLQIVSEGEPPRELVGPLSDAPIPVPAGATIRLETWQRLEDFRVRLVRDDDRLVKYRLESGPVATRSEDRPEPGGTWIALTPAEDLTPGDAYALKIEGERGERVTDAQGRDYDDRVIPLDVVTPPDPAAEDGTATADGGS